MAIILSPPLVILNETKDLGSTLRMNSAKDLIISTESTIEILRLAPQNDISTQSYSCLLKWRGEVPMDVDHWMEMAKSLDSREEGKAEELEKLKRMFERFHILNRKYLDKEAFEKAQGSGASIAEAIASTMRFLEDEIARLRSKRLKLPLENRELGEMQKVHARNESLLKDYLACVKG